MDMKFDIDRDAFAEALSRAVGVAGHEQSLPVLRNLLLRTSGDKEIEILATDLELSIKTQAAAVVNESGATTVPAKELLTIVRSLLDPSVSVQLKENKIVLTSGKSRRTLPTIPAEDFPHLDLDETHDLKSCDRVALSKALSKTMYAIPGKDDPFSLPGIFLHAPAPNVARCVASDGHRLACCDIPASSLGGMILGSGVVIPRKGVIEIAKLLDKEQELSMSLSEKGLLVKTPKALLFVRPLASEFPDYTVIIPEERPSFMAFDLAEMERRVKSMSVITDVKWKAIGLSLQPGNLTLDVRHGDGEEASDELQVEYEGDAFKTHLNLKYLLNVIACSTGDTCRMEWLDTMHGIIFKEVSDPDALHLIMPMIC